MGSALMTHIQVSYVVHLMRTLFFKIPVALYLCLVFAEHIDLLALTGALYIMIRNIARDSGRVS